MTYYDESTGMIRSSHPRDVFVDQLKLPHYQWHKKDYISAGNIRMHDDSITEEQLKVAQAEHALASYIYTRATASPAEARDLAALVDQGERTLVKAYIDAGVYSDNVAALEAGKLRELAERKANGLAK